MVWDSIIAAGASIYGQSQANETNKRLARENRIFNAEQARLNRQFQSTEASNARQWALDMDRTKHQRAANDLRAAGINPILASKYGGPPATPGSPGGATASAQAARVEDSIGKGVHSALALRRLNADVKLAEAQAKKVDAEATTEAGRPTHIQAQVEQLYASVEDLKAASGLKRAQEAKTQIETELLGHTITQTKLTNRELELQLKELERIEKEIRSNDVGRRLRHMKEHKQASSAVGLATAVGSATGDTIRKHGKDAAGTALEWVQEAKTFIETRLKDPKGGFQKGLRRWKNFMKSKSGG